MNRIDRVAAFLIPLGLALILAGAASAAAATLEVSAGLDDFATAELTLSVEGKPLCKLSKTTEAKTPAPTSCRFELGTDAKTLHVQGSYRPTGLLARTIKGETNIRLLNFAVAGQILAPSDKPYGDRMAAFIQATDQFAKQQLSDHYTLIEAGHAVDAKALAAAEKRIGFALPTDFLSMQRRIGALRLGDHSMMSVDELNDAYTQMVKVWGTPEDAMQKEYSEKFRAALKASTLLFTEVGDGYGGLLYRPGKTQACGDQGTYYWTSQEGGTSVLKQADGRCMDFAAAMRWVLNGFLVEDFAEYVSEEMDHAVLIDTSAGVQAVQLTVPAGDAFDVALRASWSGANL